MSSDINSEDPQTPEEVYQWVKGLVKQNPVEIRYSKKNMVVDPAEAITLHRRQEPNPNSKTILHIPKPRKHTP